MQVHQPGTHQCKSFVGFDNLCVFWISALVKLYKKSGKYLFTHQVGYPKQHYSPSCIIQNMFVCLTNNLKALIIIEWKIVIRTAVIFEKLLLDECFRTWL